MIRFIALMLLTLLAGCKTTSYCAFSLREDGWKPTKHPPAELQETSPFKKFWYTNVHGDYLVCPKRSSEYTCGGSYMLYVRTRDGYLQEDVIVCTT